MPYGPRAGLPEANIRTQDLVVRINKRKVTPNYSDAICNLMPDVCCQRSVSCSGRHSCTKPGNMGYFRPPPGKYSGVFGNSGRNKVYFWVLESVMWLSYFRALHKLGATENRESGVQVATVFYMRVPGAPAATGETEASAWSSDNFCLTRTHPLLHGLPATACQPRPASHGLPAMACLPLRTGDEGFVR